MLVDAQQVAGLHLPRLGSIQQLLGQRAGQREEEKEMILLFMMGFSSCNNLLLQRVSEGGALPFLCPSRFAESKEILKIGSLGRRKRAMAPPAGQWLRPQSGVGPTEDQF